MQALLPNMEDAAAQQRDEIEALQSIYVEEFEGNLKKKMHVVEDFLRQKRQ